ncbi:P2 family phage major capsid protein [Escherichia coli]|uniref:P2 family phage major capsid protein n=1 Tax=Escherichia coli TaxID=562 RepID=UPI002AA29DA6|nr:P2 family phage major capsid protein [Escherichia coli]
MNLVMSDITRNKLGCYMAQQALLNNIPVSALVSRFTVEPRLQQRFENASKESTEFTKRINVIGDRPERRKILPTPPGQLRARIAVMTASNAVTRITYDENRQYQCEQVNYDTFISYPQLDAWAAQRFSVPYQYTDRPAGGA